VKLVTSAFAWIFLYVALAIAPLFFALIGDAPEGRDFWTELSVAFGFVGLAILALQFAISARSNGVDAPYGLDVVLQFHRQMSFVGFALVLAHPLILFVTGVESWALLNVFDTRWAARMGMLSVVALPLLVGSSVWRLQLRLRYEVWRVIHDVLAVVVVVAALLHVEMVGHYVAGLWRQVLWAVMSLTIIGLLIWVRLIKPFLIVRRPWSIKAVVPRASDVWSLQLEPVGHDGMRFQPGQFAWLTIGRSPLRITEHPFSFSSSAEAREVEFTIKSAGDFTSRVGELEPGTDVFLDGPYGVFTFERNEAAGFLFIAGGIGVTPILSMLRTLADRRDRRRMTLLYASNSWDDIPFKDELQELAEVLELDVVHVLSDPPEGWTGETGFVTCEIIERHLPEPTERIRCFLCGPPPMMEAVTRELHDLGVGLDRIHSEPDLMRPDRKEERCGHG
jgi:predicted ferric reductase